MIDTGSSSVISTVKATAESSPASFFKAPFREKVTASPTATQGKVPILTVYITIPPRAKHTAAMSHLVKLSRNRVMPNRNTIRGLM